jgi:hypothetical protein
VVGTLLAVRPGRVRRLRFEYRYPLAGAAAALAAASLHELVDFGLQIPLNRYLLACWLGLLWGVSASRTEGSSQPRHRRLGGEEQAPGAADDEP